MRRKLLRFQGAVERDPAIDAWMKGHAGELGAIAHHWFEVLRKCGGLPRIACSRKLSGPALRDPFETKFRLKPPRAICAAAFSTPDKTLGSNIVEAPANGAPLLLALQDDTVPFALPSE